MIPYDFKWIIPSLRHPRRIWRIASKITVVAVGLFSKIVVVWLNKTKVHNKERLLNALDNRPKEVPLITVSNHESCFDDPGMWGLLNWRHIASDGMRWSMAAHDICFTTHPLSLFFMCGRCVPTIRGGGVYQDAVAFCIEILAGGGWVHVFPEGKVNMTKETVRLKWGVGQMIWESPVTPIVLPIWHCGMDDLLPNYPPYYLQRGKKITFNYGQPLDLRDLVAELRTANATDLEARKAITDRIQEEMFQLRDVTRVIHSS